MSIRRGVIDSEGLDVMQQALEQACTELGITREDLSNRKRLAFLVTGFARAGVYDLAELTEHVVTQFKIKI